MIKKIKTVWLQRFRNADHLAFHAHVYARVTQSELVMASLNLPESLVAEWKQLLDIESDLCNEARGTYLSTEMDTIDKLRSSLVSELFSQLKFKRNRLEPERNEAANRLNVVLKPYSETQEKNRDAKTYLIRGLINDLRKPEAAPYVEILKLEDHIAEIETCNNRYDEMFQERIEFYARRRLMKMEDIRPQIDDCFDEACYHIVAGHSRAVRNGNPKPIFDLIHNINETIARLQIVYNQMRSAKKGAGNGGPTGTNTVDGNVNVGQTDENAQPSNGENAQPSDGEGTQPSDGEGTQPSGSQDDGSQDDTQGQHPAEDPSNPSTPAQENEGNTGEGQGDNGEGGQPSAPDTGGFMG